MLLTLLVQPGHKRWHCNDILVCFLKHVFIYMFETYIAFFKLEQNLSVLIEILDKVL